MDAQTLIAGALVAGCSAWAVWLLLPARPRAWCRARLGLPPRTQAPATAGCSACNGCGGQPSAAGKAQEVKLVRRPRA